MFLAKGFQAFLSKPINLMQLNGILKKWVRDKTQEEPWSAPEMAAAEGAALAAALPDIEGLDAAKALELYGGMMNVYLPILRSYAENTPAVLEKLRRVTAENLTEYAITVHGLKGSSAGIGAEDIRAKSAGLEMLAKAGDLPGVLAKNEAFLREAEQLAGDISAWLREQEAITVKERLAAPSPAVLADLRQSLLDYDMSGIDSALERLQSADYESGAELVKWLEEKITESEFAAAASRIVDIVEKI